MTWIQDLAVIEDLAVIFLAVGYALRWLLGL
jgi:hypothetical protein